jgi:myo-inositol-1(or 4)-monophosphatase
MASPPPALSADWLGACRHAAGALRQVLDDAPTTRERAEETGSRGSGGDRTLVIDQRAEEIVFAELERLHGEGYRFTALSEERGEIAMGDAGTRVIIDPIDGSVNAKRGITHHALSLAVANGPTMADVQFAYVYDFGPGEEWWAMRGKGAWRDGELLDPELPEHRGHDGRVEVLGIESADPRWVAAAIDGLVVSAYRLRALGTVAVSLCQVAAARFDAMLTLRRTRGVDAAAGQLIVREAGGHVLFAGLDDPLGAPLTAEPCAALVAARSLQTLHSLEAIAG